MLYENCIGMDDMKPESNLETFNNANGSTILQRQEKKTRLSVSSSDSSTVSDTDSDSSTSSKEWISDHTELVQKACCEESSFDSLIDEIEKFSDSAEARRELYEEIENTWHGKNVFGATVLDDGSFAIFNAEHFD